MAGLPKKHLIISEIARLHDEMITQIAMYLSLRFPDRPVKSDPEIMANAMLALFIGLAAINISKAGEGISGAGEAVKDKSQ